MKPIVLFLALALAGCASTPRVVVNSKPQRCEIPAVVTDPVPVPARLGPGATVADLWDRGGNGGTLEAAIEKANGRLQDVQKALQDIKPVPSGWFDRLRSIFGKDTP